MKPLIIKALLLASAVTALGAAAGTASATDRKRPDRTNIERLKTWNTDRLTNATKQEDEEK